MDERHYFATSRTTQGGIADPMRARLPLLPLAGEGARRADEGHYFATRRAPQGGIADPMRTRLPPLPLAGEGARRADDDSMDGGGRATHGAVADDCMDAGRRTQSGTKVEGHLDGPSSRLQEKVPGAWMSGTTLQQAEQRREELPTLCEPGFPFSRLREKVPGGRMRGITLPHAEHRREELPTLCEPGFPPLPLAGEGARRADDDCMDAGRRTKSGTAVEGFSRPATAPA